MTEHRPEMSDAEREVLKALWDHGPGTVREIHGELRQQGRSWAYTTVTTLLQRLESKGYVACDKSRFAHVFKPRLTRDEVVREQLTSLVDDYCDGTAAPLLLALVEGRQFSAKEIEEFRQLIDQLDAKRQRAKPRK
jgi:BlaI family transcriptional regulator, penicillinase repressor